MTQSYNVAGSPEIHLDVLKAICGDTEGKSMLDLCCGFAPQTRQLGFTFKDFVDIVSRDLGEENKNFFVQDVTNVFMREDKMYDTSILLDAIEHFPKVDGLKIICRMEVESMQQIIFTPLGDYLIEEKPTDNLKYPDTHRSGWMPEEFEAIGYATIVFPNFHPTLGIGAFFATKSLNLESDFTNIIHSLNQKQWAK